MKRAHAVRLAEEVVSRLRSLDNFCFCFILSLHLFYPLFSFSFCFLYFYIFFLNLVGQV